MKIAVMPQPGKLELREIDIPQINEDEVLVKVKAVGICTWEQKYFSGVNGNESDYPFLGGHEICGVVEKVGSKVAQKLLPGDKAIIASLTRCGECYYCRRGYDNQCENAGSGNKVKGYVGPAGFSEYFVAKGYEVFKIAGDVEPAVATLAEPLACVGHSINMGRLEIGDYALVLGGGVMGLLHLLLAKQKGVCTILSEPDEKRRKKAIELGVDYVINPFEEDLNERIKEITAGRGVETVFFTAGGKKALEGGIDALAIRGTLVVYGATSSKDVLAIDPKIFHYKEISITGVTKQTKDTFRKAAEIISNKSLPLEPLISEKYPFAEIEKAFDRAKEMDTYRVVVEL